LVLLFSPWSDPLELSGPPGLDPVEVVVFVFFFFSCFSSGRKAS